MSQLTNVLRGVLCLTALIPLASNCMHHAITINNAAGYNEFCRQNRTRIYRVDTPVQNLNQEQLCKYFAAGCRVRANQLSDGSYNLHSFVPGKGGGGLLGALVAVTGTVATGLATVGAAAGGFCVGGPAGAGIAAVATAKAGMAATIYATIAATVTPAP